MYRLAVMFVSSFFLIAAPASAAGTSADKWVVTQLSGDARVVHPGVQPASVKVNSELAPGDTLLTGANGRATLVRGRDYIVVAPRSELRLPSTPQPTGFTRVIQNLGTLLFKVQHTGVPHFAVDTPMLAAVVKGTTFTVVVDQQRSAVQVIQGAVQVSALDGGMSRMVEGGRTVFVNHTAPKVLLDADKPGPSSTAPSATRVIVSAAGDSPLTAVATLTDGLVRADLTAPQTAAVNNPTTASALPLVHATQAGTSPSQTVATAPSADPTTVGSRPTVTAGTTGPGATVTVGSATVPATSNAPTTVPSLTTPAVTAPSVATTTVTVPTLSTVSNSGPGSLTSGPGSLNSVSGSLNSGPGSLNSGPGSLNSGPGSLSSGSGSLNSGPGSLSSGSGSGSTAPLLSVSNVPTVTIPSTTTPVVPVSTPTVTVPSTSTPAVVPVKF